MMYIRNDDEKNMKTCSIFLHFNNLFLCSKSSIIHGFHSSVHARTKLLISKLPTLLLPSNCRWVPNRQKPNFDDILYFNFYLFLNLLNARCQR